MFALVMDTNRGSQAGVPVDCDVSDDIIICGENGEQVEENLERWRYALEKGGMKISCNKQMCVNEAGGRVGLLGPKVITV